MGIRRMSAAERLREEIRRRILSNVRKVGDCWIWEGRTSSGYGIMNVNGRRELVRRLVYHIYNLRPRLVDEVVRDRCGNRRCVNPDHLYRGDRAKRGKDDERKTKAQETGKSRGACPEHGEVSVGCVVQQANRGLF